MVRKGQHPFACLGKFVTLAEVRLVSGTWLIRPPGRPAMSSPPWTWSLRIMTKWFGGRSGARKAGVLLIGSKG